MIKAVDVVQMVCFHATCILRCLYDIFPLYLGSVLVHVEVCQCWFEGAAYALNADDVNLTTLKLFCLAWLCGMSKPAMISSTFSTLHMLRKTV